MLATLLRCAAFLGLGLILQVGGTPQDKWPTPPKPVSQTYSLDPTNEDGGNGIRVDIKTQIVDSGQEITLQTVACNNVCLGEKHFRHLDCDDSCDVTCKSGVHKVDQAVRIDDSYDRAKFIEKIGADQTKFTGSTGQDGLALASLQIARDSIERERKRLDANFEMRCWNKERCTSSNRLIRARIWWASISWEFYRFEVDGSGKTHRVQGPKGVEQWGTIYVPIKDSWQEYKYLRCKCEVRGPKEEPVTSGAVPPPLVASGGVTTGDKPTDPPVPPAVLQQISFEVDCNDMTTGSISASNPTDHEIDFCVQPGTCFEPSSEAHQNMVLLNMVSMKLPPKGKEPIPMNGPFVGLAGDPVTAKIFVACLNMHRKMPSPDVKYHIVPAPYSNVELLAAAGAKERIRTITTQARFWILMDHVTMDQINETLIPGVTPRQYVEALHDVSAATGIPLLGDDYAACCDLKLLLAGSTKGVTNWYADMWSRKDPKGVADWMSAHRDEALKLVASSSSNDQAHAADLAVALAETGEPEVQKAAAQFLTAVPNAERPTMVAKGGLNALAALLASDDASVVSAGLDVLEAYKAPSGAFLARNLNASLPADLIARGKAVAKGLSLR